MIEEISAAVGQYGESAGTRGDDISEENVHIDIDDDDRDQIALRAENGCRYPQHRLVRLDDPSVLPVQIELRYVGLVLTEAHGLAEIVTVRLALQSVDRHRANSVPVLIDPHQFPPLVGGTDQADLGIVGFLRHHRLEDAFEFRSIHRLIVLGRRL